MSLFTTSTPDEWGFVIWESSESQMTIRGLLRWDEKAGLQRDAIRSQRLTRSRRNGKETGYVED
jgi:hypothetical protein